MTCPPSVSKAAAARFANGFKVGDFVFSGPPCLRVRVPVKGLKSGATHVTSHIPVLHEIVEVTPTGLLKVVPERFGTRFSVRKLDAHDSLNAVKVTPEHAAEVRTFLPAD